jgi:microcystin-dependent protein
LLGVNQEGNVLYAPQSSNISVPDDNSWYWVRVSHVFSPNELGVVSIDALGNLTGVGTQFLTTLRGGVNFPSKIKFTNASNNTLEYEVLQVIDNENAILSGVFTSESNLTYSVVGTFSRGVNPQNGDKEIFQYDSCLVELVEETISNDPSNLLQDGMQFMLARVRFNSVQSSLVQIQDKRKQFIYQSKSNFLLENIDREENPLIGIESIRFNNSFSPMDENLIYLSWGMKSGSFTVNTSQNKVTINAGVGGKYKSTDDFTNGDFNGWRLYTLNGKYSRILTSIKDGSQINLIVESLDINDYSSDGGITIDTQILFIAPDCEEVIIKLDSSSTDIPSKEVSFPVNTLTAKIPTLVYQDPTCLYTISYRYKTFSTYTEYILLSSDIDNGYFDENQFDSNGDLILTPTRTTYTDGEITLNINPNAYRRQIQAIDLGDLLGVNSNAISNSPNDITLQVGQDRQYQHFTGSSYSLNDNKRIILNNGLRNGNSFILHFSQGLSLGSFTLRIVDEDNNVLKSFDTNDTSFISSSARGLFIRATWNGSAWILSEFNERNNDPTGTVKMYAGNTSGIFVSGLGVSGGWVGWALCDGQNGTPDLRNRFIVGAGDDYTIGDTGGANEVVLSLDEMPTHNHDKGTLNITASGSHKHGYSTNNDQSGGLEAGNFQRAGSGNFSGIINVGSAENKLIDETHTHSSSDFNGSVGNSGSGHAHENRPPYYALAFVIKL